MRKIEEIYLLNEQTSTVDSYQSVSVAVHLHLFYLDLLEQVIDGLKSIPVSFALFISVPECIVADVEQLNQTIRGQLKLSKLKICRTPNRGRDIAPMICTFGKDLQQYEIMLHLHTKKSPHAVNQAGWFSYILNHLLPTTDGVSKILSLLKGRVGIIAPPNYLYQSAVNSWSVPKNLFFAQKLVERAGMSINLKKEYPEIDFPQGSMFWARSAYLEKLFALGLQYEDFPLEPIGVDGTIAHALERLFFLWGHDSGMCACKVYHSLAEANEHKRFYLEHERIFSDIRILSRDNQLLNHDVNLYASNCQYLAKKNGKNLILFRLSLYLNIIFLILLLIIFLL